MVAFTVLASRMMLSESRSTGIINWRPLFPLTWGILSWFCAATALPAKWRLQGDCIHYWGIQFKCHPFPLGTVFSSLMFALGMGHGVRGWGGGVGGGHQFVRLVLSALRRAFFQQTLAATDSRWHHCKSRHFTLHSDTWTFSHTLSAWLVSSWAQASKTRLIVTIHHPASA